MNPGSAAARGDLAGLQAALAQGADVDARDQRGLTSLMVAAASSLADTRTVQFLLDQGADVNARSVPPKQPALDDETRAALVSAGIDTSIYDQPTYSEGAESVLGHAVKFASIDKIKLLLDAGADTGYVDANGYSVLTNAMFRASGGPTGDLQDILQTLLDAGAPRDCASRHGESALSVASRRGEFGCVTLLMERGVDPAPLGWTPLMASVAAGRLEEVVRLLDEGADLEQRDAWSRTAWLLAVQGGHREIAELLMGRGADWRAKGRCGQTSIRYAIERQDAVMLQWLIDAGSDVEEADEFGTFPLLEACQQGAAECVRVLLAAGASAQRRTQHGGSPVKDAATLEVVRLLVAVGEDLGETEPEMRKQLVGARPDPPTTIPKKTYRKYKHRQFGAKNPDRMNNPLWDDQVRTRASAYQCAASFGDGGMRSEPVWCFQRFGHSLTRLPDGRHVEIGGEHEDYYDPDFCIYNDVVVHHGQGQFDLYGYPADVFPPTDFHSATLVWPHIYLIGNLGYQHLRRPGQTPVYRLHCETWSIERVACHGVSPGWIHGHKATLLDDGPPDGGAANSRVIAIRGGQIDDGTAGKLVSNNRTFLLNLSTGAWSVGAG